MIKNNWRKLKKISPIEFNFNHNILPSENETHKQTVEFTGFHQVGINSFFEYNCIQRILICSLKINDLFLCQHAKYYTNKSFNNYYGSKIIFFVNLQNLM